ncbi:MBL fold metallo-hydrolase [Corynebacterium kroppenstedtii]|uniref:MBL fold metallo-hydrolase n=1 Tax=Corynebacterium pseudokroppenstedtii TaxID=2804917 RepID=UPI00194E2419|nr:MBL fold metallo-hydrolase [Corynebacterium pseudokroppenstedtii]MCF6793847.1 MBL fold metallo-hydrolase [Corynebacterium pseudokroppenstedtii]MDK7147190.1 MBL fold metallo-hydrolase [Corynebacterium pseudokroppenstedtii]MDU6480119.1 MBL fold metallo-hydrolase [Corynebacterium kroppenstedtii]QRP13869.1 MBL fold metallo-hydrolase [Corynebacterium kroppenstedtii]
MRLTIIGSSGSLAGPQSPASSYLLTPDDGSDPVIMDLGPGAMGVLPQVTDPGRAHIVFTHLHADHCLDFPSLLVWRRFHPQLAAKSKHTFVGPDFSAKHLGLASADAPGDVDDFSDSFVIHSWREGVVQSVGAFDFTPVRVIHPTETYALRAVERGTGHTLVFSADTAYCDQLVDLAKGAHTLLCEASWGVSSEDAAPDMHMSGPEAAMTATRAGVKRLILTHIPPWIDALATVGAAHDHFSGEIDVATPKKTYEF